MEAHFHSYNSIVPDIIPSRNLIAFRYMEAHFHSYNSIIPDFFILRVPTVSVPFPEERIEKGLRAVCCKL